MSDANEQRESAVAARGVVKSFAAGAARTTVLHGVDLDVYTGEMTFLIGPSGCGKTTLISILAGILSMDEGGVELFGTRLRDMGGGKRVDFRARNIGFIFQQFNLLPALTAAENASIPLLAQGVSDKVATAKARDMLARLGLGDHTHKFPSQLSGGQQQRVAIARSLVHEPRLVVSDEPTASLDAQSGHDVMGLLRDIARAPGRATIVVTHDNRIFEFADRIISMSDGRVVAAGRPDEVLHGKEAA